jgi:IS30 family transposase
MHNSNKFKIEERRRIVAFMLAQSKTESEIAQQLNVDQSTISRDVKRLKEMSQKFVFDSQCIKQSSMCIRCSCWAGNVIRRHWSSQVAKARRSDYAVVVFHIITKSTSGSEKTLVKASAGTMYY